MARRAAAEIALPAAATRRRTKAPRMLMWGVAGLILATVFVLVALQVEQFLISDPRFTLTVPPETGKRDANFLVSGNFYTSEAQVHKVFARDFGRSVYLCPIAERRRLLLGIDWVEEATVSRIWPNRLSVAIRERRPVAFVQVESRSGSTVPMLIDRDGVLLNPLRPVRLKLPVLTGVRIEEAPEMRRQRVERLLKVQQELGPLMDKISEIDISELDNVKVTQPFDGHALTLLLGSQKFEQRMQNLLNNYPEIRKRLPNASVLDLRLPDRVIAVAERAPAIVTAPEAAPSAAPAKPAARGRR